MYITWGHYVKTSGCVWRWPESGPGANWNLRVEFIVVIVCLTMSSHGRTSNCQDVSIATFTNYNVSQTLLSFKPRGSLRSFWHKYPVPLLTGWQVPAGQLEQTKRHLHSHSEIVCLNAGMPQVLSLTARHKATHRWIGHRSQQARQKSSHSSVKQVRPIQRKTYKILQETGIGHECILEER
jgi:hypothetical protein